MQQSIAPVPATEDDRIVHLILGGATEIPTLGDTDLADLVASGSSVVFQSNRLLENAIAHDPRWAEVPTRAANHADRSDDDALYMAAQAKARQMVACLEDWLPERLRHDCRQVAEIVAQATADHFVLIDILAECLASECARRRCDTVRVSNSPGREDLVLGIEGSLSQRNITVEHIGLRLTRQGAKLAETALADATVAKPGANDARPSRLPRLGKRMRALLQRRRSMQNKPQPDSRTALRAAVAEAEVLIFFQDRDQNYGPNVAAILPELDGMRVCLASVSSEHEPCLKDRYDTLGHMAQDILPGKEGVLSKKDRHALRSVKLEFCRPGPLFARRYGIDDCHRLYAFSALNRLFRNLETAIAYYRSFRHAMAESALRAVVVSPSRSVPARALTVAANELGIATFDLPIGTLTRSHRQWQPIAAQVLASDRSARDIYTGFFGMDPMRVPLVGSPRLDAAVARLKAEGRPERPTGSIFVALQHLRPEVTLALVRMVAQAAARAGRRDITVGFHPRESEQVRRDILRETASQPVEIAVCKGPSLDGINQHETCITFFSFIGFEAFALGLRVIAVNPTEAAWPMRLAEAGIAEEASSAADLAALLMAPPSARNGPAGDTEILRDGSAARRIRAILEEARRARI